LNIGVENQGAGLVAMFDHRAVDHVGNEAQGPFRTDHQVLHDVKGIGEIDQGVEAVAGGVFDLELVADALAQFSIILHPVAQHRQAFDQRGMAASAGSLAFVVAGVDHRAVGEDDAHGVQGAVAVLLHPAAHAASVVGEDAADLGAVDGGRVRPNLAVKFRQDAVGLTADDAGLQLDLGGVVEHPVAVPAGTKPYQDRIGDRLAGETGARGAEGHRQPQPARLAEDQLHLLLSVDVDHDFGNQPIETGVGAEGDGAQGVGDQLLGRDLFLDALEERLVFSG